MAPVTTANFGEALYPGLKTWFDDGFTQVNPYYPNIFSVVDSDKAAESYVDSTGISLIPAADENNSLPYEDPVQGYKTTLTNVTYRKGIKVTREMMEDDQYNIFTDETAKLGNAAGRTMDYEAMKVFRRGFDTAFTSYGDAKPFFSTVHTSSAGGSSQSNASATGITLTEANLETGMVALRQQQDQKDQTVVVGVGKLMLVVPLALEKEGVIITQSSRRSATADNDLNWYEGRFTVIANPWIGANIDASGGSVGSDTAWYLLDPATHKLKFQWRVRPQFEQEDDFDKNVAKFQVRMRFSYGWCDWRGCWASKGNGAAYSS